MIVYVTRQVRCLFIIQKRNLEHSCFCSTVCMNKGTGRIFQSKYRYLEAHTLSVVDWTRRTFNRLPLWLGSHPFYKVHIYLGVRMCVFSFVVNGFCWWKKMMLTLKKETMKTLSLGIIFLVFVELLNILMWYFSLSLL